MTHLRPYLVLTLFGFFRLLAAQQQNPQDISFTADSDHSTQRYVLLLPRGFQAHEKHDVLIALHGHGSDRWQFMKPTRDETRAALDIAAKYSLIYVSPDYRAPTSWMGPKAEADVSQIIQDLKRKYQTGRIIVAGASMGGASALTYAALHSNLVDAVASMNGTANHLEYDNFQDAIRASFGGTKEQIPLEYKSRSAEYWPERLTMPIAITASGQDKIVPPESVLRLSRILRNLHRQVLLIYDEKQGHQTTYANALAALDFAVREAHQRQ